MTTLLELTVADFSSHEHSLSWFWFKVTRLELCLSQQKCAQLLGVTNMTVHRWEKGIVRLPKDALSVMFLIFYLSKYGDPPDRKMQLG